MVFPRLVATCACLVALQPGLAWADAPNPSFYLVNRSNQSIREVYASPASADRWGRDRLGDASIGAGGNAPIRLVATGNCLFDLRVVYDDGHADQRRRVDTCAVDTISFGVPAAPSPPQPGANPAHDPSFRIVNRGGRTVNEVYARLPGRTRWGRDRLGYATIESTEYRVIHLPAGQCQWDVKLVFDSGPNLERRGINLCDVTDFPID